MSRGGQALAGEPIRRAPEERPRSLAELIHRHVEHHPSFEAVRWHGSDGWGSWTFAELWDQVRAVSLGLRALGVGAGDRVLILSRSGPQWLVSDLASLALGAVTCPLYPGDPPARLVAMAHRVGARLAFVENTKLLARFRSVPWGEGAEPQIVLFEPEAGPLGSGRGSPGGLLGLGQLRDLAVRSPAAIADWERTWQAVTPTHVATIVHTIGIDGEPKGVVISHGNILHNVEAISQALPLSEHDVALSVLPMSHMFERGGGIYGLLGAGVTLAFAERSLERWVPNMVEVRPTLMAAIPLFFERVELQIEARIAAGPPWQRALFGWATGLGRQRYRNHLAGRGDGWSLRLRYQLADRLVLRRVRAAFGGRVRFLVSGGAALPEATGIFFESLGITIIEGYGLTETAPLLAVNRLASYRYGTVGPPAPGTELRLDPDSGEILARGPQVMLGYLDRPAETARALDAEGWLHTGDLGAFDEAGRLRITGRTKNLLVLATGKNVAPAPVEQALAESPYIQRAVLLGDGRDATGVLLVPDWPAVHAWAGERGPHASAADADEPMLRPEASDLLRREVDRLTSDFATFERPRRFVVLPRSLEAALGEVPAHGPTLRAAVMAAFPAQVEELFDRSRSEPRPLRAGEQAAPAGAARERVTAPSD